MVPPLLVTAAVIYEPEKILLIKRARDPFKGYWSFVGGCGAFEYTSNPQEAVKKEVRADLQCNFDPSFLTYNYETFYNKPSLVLYFIGRISGKPTSTLLYVSEHKWFSIEEARELELGYGHHNILLEYVIPFLRAREKISCG